MLYEFRWDLPGDGRPSELVLRIHSITGWLGFKRLQLNDQPIYKRGIFSGVAHRFGAIPGRPRLHLRAAKTMGDDIWRPTLYADGTVIPEKLKTVPPPNARRPKALAITIGLTYLFIFVLLIMGLSIERILDAAKSPTDSRVFLLNLVHKDEIVATNDNFSELPVATVGRPYDAALGNSNSETSWHRKTGQIPPGMTLDAEKGRLTGTPIETGVYSLGFRITDSLGPPRSAQIFIRVEPSDPPTFQIATDRLPVAVIGEPYSATLKAIGGTEPYQWICNTRKLPPGLDLKRIDPDEVTTAPANSVAEKDHPAETVWQITGTPEPPQSAETDDDGSPTVFPVTVRVQDSSYSARNETKPWFIPILVTIACLLGYWAMLRVSVLIFGGAILIEIILWYFAILPISLIAVAIQTLLLTVGIAHYKQMR